MRTALKTIAAIALLLTLNACAAGVGAGSIRSNGTNVAGVGVGVVPFGGSPACVDRLCARQYYSAPAVPPGGSTSVVGDLREMDSNFLKGYSANAARLRRIEGEIAARADHPQAAALDDHRQAAAYAGAYGGVAVSRSFAASGQLPYVNQLVCRQAHQHGPQCYRTYQGGGGNVRGTAVGQFLYR